MEGETPDGPQDVVVSQGVTWDGWKQDGPLLGIVLIGAASFACSFLVHGWARLGLQVLGGFLMWPLIMLVVLTTLGGALAGVLNTRASFSDRTALVLISVGLGVWLGSYTPGVPQELLLAPAGLVVAAFMLTGGHLRRSGRRRRLAGCLALAAIAAGITGVWLLARA